MPTDSSDMSDVTRLHELARLMAAGLLRMRRQVTVRRLASNEYVDSGDATCLEVHGDVRLSVPSGERSREPRPADDQPAGGH